MRRHRAVSQDKALLAVLTAERAANNATMALNRAVAKAFPVGAHVCVRLGGCLVHGVVTSTTSPTRSSHFEEGYVYIENAETGKPRKFSAGHRIANGDLLQVNR